MHVLLSYHGMCFSVALDGEKAEICHLDSLCMTGAWGRQLITMLHPQVIWPSPIGWRMVSADWLPTSGHMTAALHDVKGSLSPHLLLRWLRMNTGTWHLSLSLCFYPPFSLSLSITMHTRTHIHTPTHTHTSRQTQMQAADAIIYCNRGEWLEGLSWSSASIPQKPRHLITEAGLSWGLKRERQREMLVGTDIQGRVY